MSRDTLPPDVSSIASQFRHLLERARSAKPTTSIDPALPSQPFTEDVSKLAPEDSSAPEGAKRSTIFRDLAVETAARDVLYEIIGQHEVHEPDFVNVWNLLDLVQFCIDQKQCDQALVLLLVEEMLDSQTIDGCRCILDYLKSRRTQIIGSELTLSKRNIILRTCNELLHRLSRAEDAVFCGDVFVFLFQVFPLGDKSAVNLRGEFHTENTTTFDPPEDKDEPMDGVKNEQEPQSNGVDVEGEDKEQHSTEGGQESATKTTNVNASQKEPEQKSEDQMNSASAQNKTATDSKAEDAKKNDIPNSQELYADFWSLQNLFSNPQKAFDTDALSRFKRSLEITIKKFRATPKVPRVSTQSRKRKRNEDSISKFASAFNPKYLTSRDLFDLELSDLTFQREILVQSLILLDFLLSLTPKAKKKTEQLKAQRSMIYSYTLSEEDAKWCNEMKITISRYLQESNDGAFYYRMVNNVLSRDKNWVAWKVESCQDFSKEPIPLDNFVDAEESVKRTCAPRRMKASPMGAIDLSFLDEEKGDSLIDQLKESSTAQQPTRESLVREVQDVDLDLEMVDKESNELEWAEMVSRRASKTWRALRIASKKRLPLLAKIDEHKSVDLLARPDTSVTTNGVAESAESAEGQTGEESLEDAKIEEPDGVHTSDTPATVAADV